MSNYDFTKDHKRTVNYLIFKFAPKLSFLMAAGFLSSNFTSVDLTLYKKTTFAQVFVFLAIEETLNSFVPRWKDKSKAKKLVFATPINIQPAAHLNPAKPTHEL